MSRSSFEKHDDLESLVDGLEGAVQAEVTLPTVPGPRSAAVLCSLLASLAASWSLCARGLGLSWRVVLVILLSSLATLGISLAVLHARHVQGAFLRNLGQTCAALAVTLAVLSLLLKGTWWPEHPVWGGFFLSLLPLAVGGLVWMAWRRLRWLRPPLAANLETEPQDEPAQLAQSA